MAYGGEPDDNPYAAPQAELAPLADVGPVKAYGYGGFWIRFLAYVIDSFALCVPALPVVGLAIAALAVFNQENSEDLSPAQLVILLALYGSLFLLVIAYFAVMECSKYQATLGKMALGLKVTDRNGRRLSFGRSLGRTAAKVFLTHNSCTIGYIIAAFTARKQALHDLIAGTLVVKTRS